MSDVSSSRPSGRTFRLLGQLGRGAFGEVHLAELHTDDDFVQTVAVKWLHARFSGDPEVAGRLRDEARLLGLLQHPNIVRVSGLTRIDDRIAVLMEFVEGSDLTHVALSPRATADVVASVADALDAAWQTIPPGRSAPLRVVHRDIKPSNIMVTRRGIVKVMDFGVARATFETREAQTRSQQYGTARYMAPERWIDGIAEAPSDIFSLGVTLIELVSGTAVGRPRLSRQGFEDDLAEPLERLAAWPDLQALAREMVAFDPSERPDADTVRRRAGALAHTLEGDTLRSWARDIQIVSVQTGDGAAPTATVLHEDTATADPADAATLDFGTFTSVTMPVTAPTVTAPPSAGTGDSATGPSPDPVSTGSTSVEAASPAPASHRAGVPLPLIGLGFALLVALLGGVAWVTSPPQADSGQPNTTDALRPPPEPAVDPEPVLAPEPIVDPEPPIDPEPLDPQPSPRPTDPPEPAPSPAPEPQPLAPTPEASDPEPGPAPVPPTVAILFRVDAGLATEIAGQTLDAADGAVRRAIPVPADRVLQLQIRPSGPTPTTDRPFACSIPVGTVTEQWHIQAGGRCTKTG